MYSFLLILHSFVRWAVVILAFAAAVKAFAGWFGKRSWTRLDDRLGLFYTMALDIQLLVGIILYIVSPLTKLAMADFGAAMADSALRFFAVEHLLMMIVVVILAHVGRALSKKAAPDVKKHRTAAIFYGLSILLALAAIPWPFTHGRPWLRL
jgi:fumarate reductase subunit D